MALTNFALDALILETAKRRTIWASVEAERLAESKKAIRKSIRRLLRRKAIWCSDESKANYFGSTESGYRAN